MRNSRVVVAVTIAFMSVTSGCGNSGSTRAEFKVWGTGVSTVDINYGTNSANQLSGQFRMPWHASLKLDDSPAEPVVMASDDRDFQGVIHCSVTVNGKTVSQTTDLSGGDLCEAKMPYSP